ncbi:MAG TPA: hypothetical protein VKB49_11290 [Candidatus Sulfotelmatobacter sp.]|nr:hypothetical protein [Candidatus Sulfotelmatobacter sp.]
MKSFHAAATPAGQGRLISRDSYGLRASDLAIAVSARGGNDFAKYHAVIVVQVARTRIPGI